MKPDVFGMYIHIPFCVKKCDYCDFLSFSCDAETKDMYVNALIKEIGCLEDDNRELATVFIGGGTPSLLEECHIAGIMKAVRDKYRISSDAEITIECNPETLTEEKAEQYIKCGINRISFGLQSTDDKILALIGRIHTYSKFLESFRTARDAGFKNINVDMMMALPGQSEDEFIKGLKKVTELEPEHISVYSLIVEEGTKLYENLESYPDVMDEESERNMYHETGRILSEAGYKRYEISNYAKKGFESRHNLSYWELTDYICAGLGASGFYKGVRYTNTSDMDEYMNAVSEGSLYKIRQTQDETEKDLMEEFMFLGLRKTDGISYDEFRKIFGYDIKEIYKSQIEKNCHNGLLEEYVNSNGSVYLRLTERGTDISNSVMADFII